jgi:hypothetical protein
MYLTGDEKRKIKYAGLELSPETEKKLMVVMEDNHTKKEAVDYLCNGSAVYVKEEFVKFFDQYMNEWDVEEEDQEEYKKMIETNKPVFDWGVVEYEGTVYFIDYVL